MPRTPGLLPIGILAATLLSCVTTETRREGMGSTWRPDAVRIVAEAQEVVDAPQRLVLVAIDGFTPEAYLSSSSRGLAAPDRALAPSITRLAGSGVFAGAVETVVPAAVYPAHASLVTGRWPDAHGVASDRLLGDKGVRETGHWHASRLSGPTLWTAAREQRIGVLSLGWPSTLGAAIELLVPDIEPVRPGEDWLASLSGATTPWLLTELIGIEREADHEGWPTPAERDAALVTLACKVAASSQAPGLWLLRLRQAGTVLEAAGPGSPAALSALSAADAEVGRLVGCLEDADLLESTALVVVGSRAVLPVHSRIRPNLALEQAGLVTRARGDSAEETAIASWSAIARSNGGSAFVYATGESTAVLAKAALIEAAQRSGAFRVVSATELRSMGGDPLAWFGVEAEPGYLFADAVAGPLMSASPERGAGGYLTDPPGSGVGLVARGAGIRSQVQILRMRQIDVAPTVAVLMGLELDGTQGRPLVGMLAPRLRRPAGGPGASGGAR
jgi:hypothetical protein